MPDASIQSETDEALGVGGRVVLFGFPPAAVDATVRIRPRSWRVRGALQIMGVFVLIAPVVALLPPHAPWPVGALGLGALLARRRLSEKVTLLAIDGSCPKCESALRTKKTRLRAPHSLTCEGCHHEVRLELSVDAMDEEA